jgi:hypothetical protein
VNLTSLLPVKTRIHWSTTLTISYWKFALITTWKNSDSVDNYPWLYISCVSKKGTYILVPYNLPYILLVHSPIFITKRKGQLLVGSKAMHGQVHTHGRQRSYCCFLRDDRVMDEAVVIRGGLKTTRDLELGARKTQKLWRCITIEPQNGTDDFLPTPPTE